MLKYAEMTVDGGKVGSNGTRYEATGDSHDGLLSRSELAELCSPLWRPWHGET